MEYIASGAQADIYKDGSKVIKIFKNYVPKNAIENEVNLQRMAYDYGLSVPEIFDIIEINGKIGIVYERHTKKFILSTNKLIQSEKEKILYENKLCHGDFHIINLIQTSNDIKIVDWVCASSGNPEADICRTFLLYKTYMEELAEIYLETSCKIKNVDKLKIVSWLSIIAGQDWGNMLRIKMKKVYLRK